MREGRTLTRPMSIDSRQHEIVGIDLGEGVGRGAALFGLITAACWVGLLWLVGVPWSKETSLLWMGPPIALTAYGWTDGACPRRRRVTEWVLTIRWIVHGHLPIVALGRHPLDRTECMPLRQRLAYRLMGAEPHVTDEEPVPAGTAVRIAPTVQLVGIDWMHDAMTGED